MSPMVERRSKGPGGLKGGAQEAPAFKIANSGPFYTRQVLQNKQTTTLKDTKKDSQLVEYFYFQNRLTCPSKIAKQFFLVFNFSWQHKTLNLFGKK